jgi:hypothetical protein
MIEEEEYIFKMLNIGEGRVAFDQIYSLYEKQKQLNAKLQERIQELEYTLVACQER